MYKKNYTEIQSDVYFKHLPNKTSNPCKNI